MTTEKINLEAELADIQRQTENTLNAIKGYGFELDMTEWLTIARYARKYNVNQQVVVNRISRGVIPTDSVKDIPDLNNIRLVKDRVYL